MFENVHPSAVPGPFWPKRVADRRPITTDSCVFRSGLKSGPREPKGRKSAPAGFLKALPRIGPKTEVHQTLCFTMRNCFRTKNLGPYFSKNVAPLQRQGPFTNPPENNPNRCFSPLLPPDPSTVDQNSLHRRCFPSLGQKIEENKGAQTIVFYDARRP